jgi:uncharacterized protein YndB with AHSA1/START domain
VQAQVKNISYKTYLGEKVLCFSFIVPVNKEKAWKLFTTDSLLTRWIAPAVNTKPAKSKNGNSISKDDTKKRPPSDSSYIKLKAITYLENESLTLKVDLSNDFSKTVQQQADDLMETVQFIDTGDGKTKIVSSMTGWGIGEEWDKVYNFFVTGNEWKYNKFLGNFNAGFKAK